MRRNLQDGTFGDLAALLRKETVLFTAIVADSSSFLNYLFLGCNIFIDAMEKSNDHLKKKIQFWPKMVADMFIYCRGYFELSKDSADLLPISRVLHTFIWFLTQTQLG